MNTTMTDDAWIELFIIELRLRRVPGAAIGDAVASVRELLADSGQSAQDAFGPARDYAASLDLPVMDPRHQALKTVLLPVLGLFAFLVFALASSALFNDVLVLLSVPQALLLAVPVLLTVMFAFPFYPRAALRQRWIPAILVLVAGAAGALATLLAPDSASDAWLVIPTVPLLIGALIVLIALSVAGTVVTVRSGDGDEITTPLPAHDTSSHPRSRRPFLLFVDWLFPILAVVIFAMTWGFSLLRP